MTNDLRTAFEAYFADSRRDRGASKRPTFEQREDGTYSDDHTQRHWWTWQRAIVARPAPAMLAGESDIMELVEQYSKLMRDEAWYSAGLTFDKIRAAIAAKAGAAAATDVARLDWLDETAENACIEIGFEMDGGVYLRLDAPGEEPIDIREKNGARAAIDAAKAARG